MLRDRGVCPVNGAFWWKSALADQSPQWKPAVGSYFPRSMRIEYFCERFLKLWYESRQKGIMCAESIYSGQGNKRRRQVPAHQWLPTRKLFFIWRGLLALLVFGPRRNYAQGSRVRDGLAEMFRGVARHKEQYSALSIPAAKPVEAFLQVGVRHFHDCVALMRERVLQNPDHLGFIRRGFFQLGDVNSGRNRRTDERRKVVTGGGNVQENL